MKEFTFTPEMTVLDLGFSEIEYSDTDNYLEKHYPHQSKITALGIDQPKEFLQRYPKVKCVSYDGTTFPFTDKQFDICWSNAVMEHVGDRQQQLRFLSEIRRVAKHGFLTTPNKHFPIEVHTRVPLLHLLPKPWFDAILRKLGKNWATGDYMHLFSEKDLRRTLAEAGYKKYRIIKNRILFWPVDFVVVF
ncbi:MAG: methyltransferase domain-containing protein [bacterium]|nr:methyltransferase domain-containing protein [bacterium]